MVSVKQRVGKRNTGQSRVGGHSGEGSPHFLCMSSAPTSLAAAVRVPCPRIAVPGAGRCVGACCPHVAKMNIALVLEGPLPLEAHWAVLGRPQTLENQRSVQRGCISGPGSTCWHAPLSANGSPGGGVWISHDLTDVLRFGRSN